MKQKHSNRENIEETEKPNEKIREILGAIVLFAVLIFKTVFHKQDYDTVFDVGGKVAIIVLILLFCAIYYIQIKKNDNG
jgi:H+/gluconate symporter-like permease